MSFLQPLLLLGVLAGAVPLAIHLIGRRRAPRRPFAALDFVLRSNRRLAQRLKLRQLLLLAVRVGLIVGIAVMMAKPVAEAESDLPAFGRGPQSAVIVVDDSLSMRYRPAEGRPSFFDRAKQRALELLKLLGGQAEVAVITTTDPAGPLPGLTRDLRRVRGAVVRLEATYRHAGLGGALAQARVILTGASLAERRVFVLSDFAAHGGSISGRAGDAEVHRIDVAGTGRSRGWSPPNRAVVELRAEPSTAPGQRSTRISARVCNYAAQPARVAVRLEIDGQRVAAGRLALAPRACGDKGFQHAFSRGGGHEAVASISADRLVADDRRYLRVDVQNDVRALLVNGSPSPIRHRDELFYLEAALHSGADGQRIVAESTTLAELERARFDAYDVVVLCNVRGLAPARAARLRRFVAGGGGLLIAVGDRVRPEELNRSLGQLLPQPLRGPSTAALRGAGSRRGLRIGRIDGEHPVIAAIWANAEGVGLRSARFVRTYRLRPAPASDRRVVLSFDDGSPALIERRVGAGRAMLLASTLDRDWNDLPIRPGYLPLMQQIVRYLARALAPGEQPSVVVGSTRLLRSASGDRQLRLVEPGGEERIWQASSLGARAAEVRAQRPGFYRVYASSAGGRQRLLTGRSFAANLDPRESDLSRRAPEAEQGGPSARRAGRATRRVELWHGLGVALLLLLLCESMLTRRK